MSPGLADNATQIGDRLLQNLPAQFLALVLLNAAFIAGTMWFLQGVDTRRMAFEQANADARERILGPALMACIGKPQPQPGGNGSGNERR